jgi:hypothetical protein
MKKGSKLKKAQVAIYEKIFKANQPPCPTEKKVSKKVIKNTKKPVFFLIESIIEVLAIDKLLIVY